MPDTHPFPVFAETLGMCSRKWSCQVAWILILWGWCRWASLLCKLQFCMVVILGTVFLWLALRLRRDNSDCTMQNLDLHSAVCTYCPIPRGQTGHPVKRTLTFLLTVEGAMNTCHFLHWSDCLDRLTILYFKCLFFFFSFVAVFSYYNSKQKILTIVKIDVWSLFH